MTHYLLFDLDGTITDPGEGITNSVMYALSRMQRPVPPREALYPFIGPPLVESFQRFSSMSESEATDAVAIYREYFSTRGIFENALYPEIPDLLTRLREAGFQIALATSKPEIFARRILAHFALDSFFDFVGGADLAGERGSKAAVIGYVLREIEADAADCTMIGDRLHDVEGAAAYGIPTVGVTWGYGSREELTKAGAAAIADTTATLYEILTRR